MLSIRGALGGSQTRRLEGGHGSLGMGTALPRGFLVAMECHWQLDDQGEAMETRGPSAHSLLSKVDKEVLTFLKSHRTSTLGPGLPISGFKIFVSPLTATQSPREEVSGDVLEALV